MCLLYRYIRLWKKCFMMPTVPLIHILHFVATRILTRKLSFFHSLHRQFFEPEDLPACSSSSAAELFSRAHRNIRTTGELWPYPIMNAQTSQKFKGEYWYFFLTFVPNGAQASPYAHPAKESRRSGAMKPNVCQVTPGRFVRRSRTKTNTFSRFRPSVTNAALDTWLHLLLNVSILLQYLQ